MIRSQPLHIPRGTIGYAEKPYRRAPEAAALGGDIYQATPEERERALQHALDTGISFFHAAHEREATSLGASLRTLDVRSRVSLSTTDGDVLDRCPDTADGAAQAIRAAIARKQALLGFGLIDAFSLYDIRRDVHTPARIAGARQALEDARLAGSIGAVGATCYDDYDALTEIIQAGTLPLEFVLVRYNYARPACSRTPVTRLPRAWRCRPGDTDIFVVRGVFRSYASRTRGATAI